MTEDQGAAWEDTREQLLADPATRAEYEASRPAHEVAGLLIGIRSKLGLTQRELALAAGMQHPAIARIESGKVSPSWETLWRILDAVGARVTIDVELPKWDRARKTIEIESGDHTFRTIEGKPGYLEVIGPEGDKEHAVAWPGAELVELHPARNGVIVMSAALEGEIARNVKGAWVLAEAHHRGEPSSPLSELVRPLELRIKQVNRRARQPA
jgi:transcriptional regulator with XRE-family HTH domain